MRDHTTRPCWLSDLTLHTNYIRIWWSKEIVIYNFGPMTLFVRCFIKWSLLASSILKTHTNTHTHCCSETDLWYCFQFCKGGTSTTYTSLSVELCSVAVHCEKVLCHQRSKLTCLAVIKETSVQLLDLNRQTIVSQKFIPSGCLGHVINSLG